MLLSPAPTMRLLSCPTTETTGHHAGNKTTNLKTTLTLELRTIELISGISRLDLKPASQIRRVHGAQEVSLVDTHL